MTIFAWIGASLALIVVGIVGQIVDPHAGWNVVLPASFAGALVGSVLGLLVGRRV